ncbi:MAG: response regulator transcription factor [Planctomycetota bacterium]|jgi:DNA-binding response OmpR family regulator
MSQRIVLVVEDDPAIRRGIVDTLAAGGYGTLESADGEEGLRLALSREPDLVLIDIMLPRRDGYSLLEEVRKAKPSLPAIMVTARGAEADRVRGLKGGADDYVVKPFSALELLARVEAVLRRSAERPTTVGTLVLEGRTVDLERREVTLADGHVREISVKEAELLQYLAGSRGRAISRDELLQRVWGLDPRGVTTRTIDMHIARLREKLDDDPGDAHVIRTVRGKGYMLV